METGAHPPGEPAVPGEERADAGVPAAATLPPGHAVRLDRELERNQIDRVLETARQGRSAALMLQGEPGTGKTTLLDYAAESGRDFEIVRLLGSNRRPSLASPGCISFYCRFWPGSGLFPYRSGTLWAGRSASADTANAGPARPVPRLAGKRDRHRGQLPAAGQGPGAPCSR